MLRLVEFELKLLNREVLEVHDLETISTQLRIERGLANEDSTEGVKLFN